MKFTSKCKITAGKSEILEFPNMSKALMIPMRVVIFEGQATACKEILCKIVSGSTELVNLAEPYFVQSNLIDLSDHMNAVKRGCDLIVSLTNKSRDVKQYTVEVEYEKSFGAIIYQQKTDKFDRILKDIHLLGTCTRLVLSFNRPIKELQLRTLTECDGNDWISPLEVTVNEETPGYTIEFTDDLSLFAQNLNFMQLVVGDSTNDNQVEPLQVYVLAYGYMTKK